MYDVDYFIKKFEAIPDNEWCEGDFVNPSNPSQRCALGHCGMNFSIVLPDEAYALTKLFDDARSDFPSIVTINDGKVFPYKELKHPKLRILKALYDLKERNKNE